MKKDANKKAITNQKPHSNINILTNYFLKSTADATFGDNNDPNPNSFVNNCEQKNILNNNGNNDQIPENSVYGNPSEVNIPKNGSAVDANHLHNSFLSLKKNLTPKDDTILKIEQQMKCIKDFLSDLLNEINYKTPKFILDQFFKNTTCEVDANLAKSKEFNYDYEIELMGKLEELLTNSIEENSLDLNEVEGIITFMVYYKLICYEFDDYLKSDKMKNQYNKINEIIKDEFRKINFYQNTKMDIVINIIQIINTINNQTFKTNVEIQSKNIKTLFNSSKFQTNLTTISNPNYNLNTVAVGVINDQTTCKDLDNYEKMEIDEDTYEYNQLILPKCHKSMDIDNICNNLISYFSPQDDNYLNDPFYSDESIEKNVSDSISFHMNR